MLALGPDLGVHREGIVVIILIDVPQHQGILLFC